MTEYRKQDYYVPAPWHDEDSIWSKYNQQNIKLYPNAEKWDEIETGILVSDKPVRKYVRKPDSE